MRRVRFSQRNLCSRNASGFRPPHDLTLTRPWTSRRTHRKLMPRRLGPLGLGSLAGLRPVMRLTTIALGRGRLPCCRDEVNRCVQSDGARWGALVRSIGTHVQARITAAFNRVRFIALQASDHGPLETGRALIAGLNPSPKENFISQASLTGRLGGQTRRTTTALSNVRRRLMRNPWRNKIHQITLTKPPNLHWPP